MHFSDARNEFQRQQVHVVVKAPFSKKHSRGSSRALTPFYIRNRTPRDTGTFYYARGTSATSRCREELGNGESRE